MANLLADAQNNLRNWGNVYQKVRRNDERLREDTQEYARGGVNDENGQVNPSGVLVEDEHDRMNSGLDASLLATLQTFDDHLDFKPVLCPPLIVAGGKLSANSPAYNKWKAENGFETKRGHQTNNTQIVLDTKDLIDITIRGKRGNWRVIITMKRQSLYKEVGGITDGRSYIEFYEENKVPNDTITAFKPGWVRNGRAFFKHLE